MSWHPQTQRNGNLADAAHIIGFSEDGPRGEGDLSAALASDVENLMLLCSLCHRAGDTDEELFTVDALRKRKIQHESRVHRLSEIDGSRQSQILLYGANIGDHSSCLTYEGAAAALATDLVFPASRDPLALGLSNSSFRDRTGEFWQIEAAHLRHMVQQRVQPCLSTGGIEHLSIFALAPQPLLTFLGYLLCDVNYNIEVYQLHREPPNWSWRDGATELELQIVEPEDRSGLAALVLSMSATVTDDRIRAVLGDQAAIWRLGVRSPHHDVLRSARQLGQFRATMRRLLDRIKSAPGISEPLHVFPAVPVSAAVELGRIIQPKADMHLRLYDQNNGRGGFAHAFDIPWEKSR